MQSFLNERYGRKTERHDDPNQLRIAGTPEHQTDERLDDSPAENKKQNKPGHGRNPMPSHLRRETIRRAPTALEATCCAAEVASWKGNSLRSERYECVPATFYVEQIVDGV